MVSYIRPDIGKDFDNIARTLKEQCLLSADTMLWPIASTKTCS